MTTIIFDVEGTLMDCVPQTLESWRLTLDEFGHSVHREQLQPYSGMDGGEMLECLLAGLAKDTRQQMLKQQGALYTDQYLRVVRPFPGVREMFVALAKKGLSLAIATTCKHDELAIYDKHLRVLNLADAVVCGDDVEHGKPHPDLFRAVLRKLGASDTQTVLTVGDTPYDAQAATALGLASVGVLTGGFTREALEKAGCTRVLEGVRAVVPHLSFTLLTVESASGAARAKHARTKMRQ